MIQTEIVGYLFGEVEDDTRRAVEEHLVVCAACLREFFDLKRSVETSDAQPSPELEARLRRSVAAEISARVRRFSWSWWERPLALGLAGVMVMMAMIAVQRLSSSRASPPRTWTGMPLPSG